MKLEQAEFDFGAPRQQRIVVALRAVPMVKRAVPLSDSDKLMLACMDSLARQIAVEVQALDRSHRRRHTATRIALFVDALEDVSVEFARETTRYLMEAVSRFGRECNGRP